MMIENKVVFLTDATSASGIEIARKASSEGAKLVLNCLKGEKPDDLEKCIRTSGAEYFITNENLYTSKEAADTVEMAVKRFGTIDVLICNNNKVYRSSVEKGTIQELKQVLCENVKYAFLITQAVGRIMAQQKAGKIIYISSIHDEKPSGCTVAYSMAKGALRNLSNEVALQLGEHGVDVHLVEMGPVEREAGQFLDGKATFYEAYQYKIPSCHVGDYRDLAHLAMFLASPETKYLNGTIIRMDGGLVLHYVDTKANYRKLVAEGRVVNEFT
jgi:NAD(P)-dependent dehydrogenase (short-subunit alcohol dehydrogenase family)